MAQWYYAHNEEQLGPVTAAALKEMAQQGKIGRDDLIWREGMQRWAPASKVRGLFTEEESPPEPPHTATANGSPPRPDLAESDGGSAAHASGDEPSSDVLPAGEDGAQAQAGEDGDGLISNDDETAIDELPLGGPEESKLHVPVLTAPTSTPNSRRSASDEIVVFEPAASSPPPPTRKSTSSESDQPRTQDSSVERQTRIDLPARGPRVWPASIGLFLQTFTWVSCLLVIIAGGVVYMGTLMLTADTSERLAASGIYATFVLAAYFLARSTERICRACGQWLGASQQRQSRRSVRERNWHRFQ